MGPVFRPVNKGDRVTQGRLTGNCIRLALRKYTSELGFANLAPHDLRSYAESRTRWSPISKGLDKARCGIVLLLLALRIGEARTRRGSTSLFQTPSSAYRQTPST